MQATKEISFKKLKKTLKKVLDAKRFEHSVGVEYTAMCLAMRYGVSLYDARLAGVLHDCAKCLSHKKKIEICEKNGLGITDVERRNPFLLHTKVGAFLAKTKYSIENEDILNAILYHTTGRPNMSMLEKIIFIADYIEPERNQAPNLTEIRKIAFEDIDKALIMILNDTLIYLKDGNGELDPMTEETYQFYMKAKEQ